MEKINDLHKILEEMKVDIEKFYDKGQNAAGTRLRKQLNELRKKAAEIRKDIQDERVKRKSEGK
ncbi:MAG: histone H1 [Ignavibacteria bacterium]|nr:histone H1 [Ignavibacteria bacterium]